MEYVSAAEALAPIMALTGGWDHEASTIYLAELSKLEDAEALMAVCARLAANWRSEWRPPLGEILTAYQFETRRRQMAEQRPALEGPRCDYVRGIQIARENYAAECRLQGRPPNDDYFNSMFSSALRTALARNGE